MCFSFRPRKGNNPTDHILEKPDRMMLWLTSGPDALTDYPQPWLHPSSRTHSPNSLRYSLNYCLLYNPSLKLIRKPGFRGSAQFTCDSWFGAISFNKPLFSWLQTPVGVLLSFDVCRQTNTFCLVDLEENVLPP